MSEFGLRPKILVKDVMSSPVVTVDENETTNKIAITMEKEKLGAVVITDKEKKSVGIITERDLVVRVIAKNKKPDEIKAKEIMTTPLITTNPEDTVSDAARRMTRSNVRRLAVFCKGKLTGIVSNKDLLSVMPELMEIMQEHTSIENATITTATIGENPIGYCDQCEAYSENLKPCNGQNLCDECRIELEQEE